MVDGLKVTVISREQIHTPEPSNGPEVVSTYRWDGNAFVRL